MGHTSRSEEDSGAENNVDYGGSAQEENNISKWPRIFLCLVKNVAAFSLVQKNLPEALGCLSFGLLALAEETSR